MSGGCLTRTTGALQGRSQPTLPHATVPLPAWGAVHAVRAVRVAGRARERPCAWQAAIADGVDSESAALRGTSHCAPQLPRAQRIAAYQCAAY